MTTPRLYHYTCHHSWSRIGNTGRLLPATDLARIPPWWWPGLFVWMTDLAAPARDPLGLSNVLVACDRTAFRYEVTDTSMCEPWTDVARHVPNRHVLEDTPGARPRHWWVSSVPVPVRLSPDYRKPYDDA